MDDIKLRAAVVTDLDQLYIFEQDIIGAERAFDPTLKKEKTHYYDLKEMITSPNVRLVVAELNNIIIATGYASIVPSKPWSSHTRHAYLGFMYVLPQFRGQGINGRIIDALKEWAYSHNTRELRLEVYSDNISALNAYEKIGFSKHILEMRYNSGDAENENKMDDREL